MTQSSVCFPEKYSRPFIGGDWVSGRGGDLTVEDPSNESVIGQVATADLGQFDDAVHAARQSFDAGTWSRRPASERTQVLRAFIDHLQGRKDRLLSTAIAEVGTPCSIAEAFHVIRPLYMAGETLKLYTRLPEWQHNDVPPSELFGPARGGGVAASIMRYDPIGVVAAITAYNAPMYINLAKVVPALAAGCSVVLRPNALTPFSALALGEAAQAAGLPDGVLSVVVETGSEGAQRLTGHLEVDAVSFTGSAPVGTAIARDAAATLKRLTLELGGKSVQLYLEDSLHRAAAGARGVLDGIAGQGCSLPTRMLVPEDRRAEVTRAVVAMATSIKAGDPRDPTTTLGPVISAAQRDRCAAFVAAAQEHGAEVASGGRRPAHLDRGHFFEPTVLSMSDHRNPAAVDEIFGPVLCIIGYSDVDHAISIANDSKYGLDGVVYAQDPWQGYEIASRINSGVVGVNAGLYSSWVSAGGVRLSGIGRERGVEGIRSFQQQKHVFVQNS